jgi:hypothetical protein
LKLGVGKTREGEQFLGELLPGAQSGQDAFNVGDGSQYLARFDLGDLAL